MLKIAITVAVCAFIIRKFGWEEIAETIRGANPFYVLLAAVVFGLSSLIGVYQWQILLRSRSIEIPYWTACKLYYIGMFFNNFVFGAAAGDAVRVSYLKLANHSGRSGLAATFLDRIAGLWAMLGFAVAGSLVLMQRGMMEEKSLLTAFMALVGAFVVLSGITAFLLSRRLQALVHGLLERVRVPYTELLHTTLEQMQIEARDARLMWWVILLSVVIQLMRIGVHILCGAALGLLTAANFQYFFIFVPILAMIMIVPLPFGIPQSVGGSLFAMAGFAPGAAFVMEFLAAVVGMLVSSIGGVFFVMHRAASPDST